MTLNLIREEHLKVSSLHKVYFAEYGDSQGIPVVFIHGGPGDKGKVSYLDYLPEDLNFRAILFDQRGCGQSLPVGEIKQNTTADLIEDINKLRQHLNIDKWYVVGGSWGSTLALLYAQAYPTQVIGLFLRNIALMRYQDLAWIYSEDGVGRFFPDKKERLKKYMENHKLDWSNLISHVYQVLQSNSLVQKKQTVSLLSDWEWGAMNLDVPIHQIRVEEIDEKWIASFNIYIHYAFNRFFIKENQILDNLDRIKNIPTTIVHGRYDMLCPPEQAYSLHKKLPKSKLVFVNYSGHLMGWDGKLWFKHLILSTIEA